MPYSSLATNPGTLTWGENAKELHTGLGMTDTQFIESGHNCEDGQELC